MLADAYEKGRVRADEYFQEISEKHAIHLSEVAREAALVEEFFSRFLDGLPTARIEEAGVFLERHGPWQLMGLTRVPEDPGSDRLKLVAVADFKYDQDASVLSPTFATDFP